MFVDVIQEPIHQTPHFLPQTYDKKGYTRLLNTLISWELTRSMYDWKFGTSLNQIKSLSRIINSDYGMAMFHYFEGIRHEIADPSKAENDFLKALKYFEEQKDSSAILHTAMHLFRLSQGTAMNHEANLKRHSDLYKKVIFIGSNEKNPLNQVVYLRNLILYDAYFYGEKNANYYMSEIDKGLTLIKSMDGKYDYYKFLMMNALGTIHSKRSEKATAEKYDLDAYEIIKNYPSKELQMAACRIAAMKYEQGKYKESAYFLNESIKNTKIQKYNVTYVQSQKDNGDNFSILSSNYYKSDDNSCHYFSKDGFTIFTEALPIRNYNLYLQDMAALHKNEEDIQIILENEKKQSNSNLIFGIVMIVAISVMSIIYTRIKINKNKKLQEEIRKRDYIYSLIGHDLASPMQAMDSMLSHLEKNLPEQLAPSEKKYLTILRSKVKGAHHLLLNLLQWSKSNHDLSDQNLDKHLYDVRQIIAQSVEHFFFESANRTIVFNNLCPEHIRFSLDQEKFKAILRNIIDNAIKHSSCDTINVNANIEHKKLMITINDNGVEMNPTYVHLFNASNTIFDSTDSKIKLGLGTIFILEFAKFMNSTIKISLNDKGTLYHWEIST
jgi:signal transduction histidine kinase